MAYCFAATWLYLFFLDESRQEALRIYCLNLCTSIQNEANSKETSKTLSCRNSIAWENVKFFMENPWTL